MSWNFLALRLFLRILSVFSETGSRSLRPAQVIFTSSTTGAGLTGSEFGTISVEGSMSIAQLSCSHHFSPPLLKVFRSLSCAICFRRSCIHFRRSSSVISGSFGTVVLTASDISTAAFRTRRIGVCDRVLAILCTNECFNLQPDIIRNRARLSWHKQMNLMLTQVQG